MRGSGWARAVAAGALVLAGSLLASPAALAEPRAKRTVGGSCTFPRSCQEYDAAIETAKQRCAALGAVWNDVPCPREDAAAACVNAWDEGEVVTRFYRPTARAEAASLCEAGRGKLR